MDNRKKGKEYEKKAAEYLKDKGYDILATNFSNRFGEIDIIAVKDIYLCFVEVKYRKDTSHGCASSAVSLPKIKKICKCADYYMYINKLYDKYQARFDVIAIQGEEVTFYENAFSYHGSSNCMSF